MDIKGFHLELTNICTLKCPRCSRTEFINKFPTKWKNYSLNFEDFKNFIDIDIKNIEFCLCGNYGDPIYYSELFDLCKWLKSKGAKIEIVTNGSYKSQDWWVEFGEILDLNDQIIWSIDGTPTNFTDYRINANWESIKYGIDVISKTNIQTCWKYIVFKYNQENIKEVEKLSKDLNIKKFKLEKSDRWLYENDPYRPDSIFIGKNFNNKENFKKKIKESNINPQCFNQRKHFITADGYYAPCCFIPNHNFYYKTIWGKDKKNYKIKENKLSLLLQRNDVVNFYNNLTNNIYPDVCSFNCGICKN